jgi:hypothetical protein
LHGRRNGAPERAATKVERGRSDGRGRRRGGSCAHGQAALVGRIGNRCCIGGKQTLAGCGTASTLVWGVGRREREEARGGVEGKAAPREGSSGRLFEDGGEGGKAMRRELDLDMEVQSRVL